MRLSRDLGAPFRLDSADQTQRPQGCPPNLPRPVPPLPAMWHGRLEHEFWACLEPACQSWLAAHSHLVPTLWTCPSQARLHPHLASPACSRCLALGAWPAEPWCGHRAGEPGTCPPLPSGWPYTHCPIPQGDRWSSGCPHGAAPGSLAPASGHISCAVPSCRLSVLHTHSCRGQKLGLQHSACSDSWHP